MANTPTIADVQTLVVPLPQLAIADVIKKFQGRHTPRTLAAARRIRAKSKTIKIPRNLLRQLWRITGGWKLDQVKEGWSDTPTNTWKVIRLGDLEVVIRGDNYPRTNLLYRGQKVVNIDYGSFLNQELVRGARDALGVPYAA